MENDLVQAWRRSCALNYLLFDALPEAALRGAYAPRTRTVAAQFAHMHSVRVYHLEARGRRFQGALKSFPRGAKPSRKEIREALAASDGAIAAWLVECVEKGSVPSWHGPPATCLAYFVAHEAHHRGLAMAALRLSGTKVPDAVKWGLWQHWSKEPGRTGPGPGRSKAFRKQ